MAQESIGYGQELITSDIPHCSWKHSRQGCRGHRMWLAEPAVQAECSLLQHGYFVTWYV